MRLKTDKITEIRDFFSSARGRDVLLYLVFVIISFVFWAILALNNFVQYNYHVKFRIAGIPENVTIINDYPSEFNVAVRSHGYMLLKYLVGEIPEIVVDFKNYSNGNDLLKISKQELADLLVDKFGTNANIVSFSPEYLSIKYTSLPGKKVPVAVIGDYTANFQYVVNGKPMATPDSVTIYSDVMHLNGIVAVSTEKIVSRNLTDSLNLKVSLQKIQDVKVVPDSVNVVLPVEPLVMKRSSIPVSVKNVPDGVTVMVFPSVVSASYLLPMSLYNVLADERFEAAVDYKDIGVSAKLPVRIESAPEAYKNIKLENDSVEYIIERR